MQILQSGAREVRIGDRVRGRGQRWLVGAIERFSDCAIVTLSGLDAENHGAERRVLTPFDELEPIAQHRRLRLVGRTPWRRACRALIANDGPVAILRTARSAQMELLPHQLEPALAVARGLGSRMLIADAVGLGKTVQAGLVIAELRARGAAPRVLVLTPAGLREQWIEELNTRFRLRLTLCDALAIRTRQRRLPVGVNPWATEALAIASTDYVKRPEVLSAVLAAQWDVVVVDEAHGSVSGSDRHAAVSALCRAARHVVLLTATPHNGDAEAFASLCGIGARTDNLLVFRRTRAEVGLEDRRRVHQLLVWPTDAERQMHASLEQFASAVARDHGTADDRSALALTMLRKRARSSAWSLERSVRRRLACLDDGPPPLLQLALPFEMDEGGRDADDAPPEWTGPVLHDASEERALLTQLAGAARHASMRESKLTALQRLLRRIHEPVIVFTEYRDTLMHVHDTVAPDAAILHGGLSRDERRVALAKFSRGAVLLTTDAAGEGLNLHHASRVVVNLELPWNPMRLEQRIGRVDRIGQRRLVHAFHLIAAGTDELALRERLAMRVAQARAEIGAADPLASASSARGGRQRARVGPPDQPPPRLRRSAEASAKAEGGHDALVTPPVGGESERGGTRTPLVRLQAAAAEEVARLRVARAVVGLDVGLDVGLEPPPEADAWARGPLVARPGRRMRARLGLRTLVLLQSTAVVWTGQVVASHITGALCRGGDRRMALADLDRIAATVLDPATAGWRVESEQAHRAFWDRRLQREAAIAHDLAADLSGSVQPGLFDLRASGDRARQAGHLHAMRREAASRVEMVERWRLLTFQPAVPVLVLVP